MTNDSHRFRTRAGLEAEGAYAVRGGYLKEGEAIFLPLYEGKMVQAFDHRAASVEVDPARRYRPGQPVAATRSSTQIRHGAPSRSSGCHGMKSYGPKALIGCWRSRK